MSTVAVFGGSFSPVHTGHLAVAEGLVRSGLADEVWLTPCRKNPLKTGPCLMSDEERVNLLGEAISFMENTRKDLKGKLKISEIELGMEIPSYTIKTLERLSEEYPSHTFRLAVGADSYLDFEKWRDWERIEKRFAPVVYPRPGYEIGNLREGWTRLENVEEIDISSTELREKMSKGSDTSEYMPWLWKN